jgi:SAM-dependent MidA family methyltransferase
MAQIPPAKWAEVERHYFEGCLTLVEIGAKAGVRPDTILNRAKKLGWPPYSSLRVATVSSERARLRALIGKKLEHLEARMKDPELITDADTERQTRAVASLLNSVEKLDAKETAWRDKVIQAATDDPPPAKSAANAQPNGACHVDQWRRELARRIASLAAKWQQ